MSDLTTKAAEIRAGLARKLSDALLTVRPLGGSELFMRVGEEFYADPAVCAAEIAKLRSDLHEARTALVRERREAAALIEQQAAELAEARAENDRLRAALANSDQPCAYCSLPKDEWAKCASGFPGCDRADDAMGCPELGASLRATTAETERDELLREKERHWGGIRECPQERDERIDTAWADGARFVLNELDQFTGASQVVRDKMADIDEVIARRRAEVIASRLERRRGSGQNLADAHSKSPSPSSQSVRIAVLEAALAAEREACAQIAAAAVDNDSRADCPFDGGAGGMGYRKACYDIEEAIRARSALAHLGEE